MLNQCQKVAPQGLRERTSELDARLTGKITQNLCITICDRVQKTELAPSPPSDFELPFGGKLSADNCWVKIAELIPWSEFELAYAENFPTEMGVLVKSFRMALGALII